MYEKEMNNNMPYFFAIGLVPFLLLYEVGGGLQSFFPSIDTFKYYF